MEVSETVLVVDSRKDSASFHIAFQLVMNSVVHRAEQAGVAGRHRMAAEESHVLVTRSASARKVRMAGSCDENMAIGLADSRHSEDRTVGDCTSLSPCRVRFCVIDGFHDSENAHEHGRQ